MGMATATATAMAMAMAKTMATAMAMAMIDRHSLYDSNEMIRRLYIFLFIFDENAKENLWAMKGMGGGRGTGHWFFAMAMVTVMAMVMAMAKAMIHCCSLYHSNETIAAIIYFPFYI